jgi:hypothetical protein
MHARTVFDTVLCALLFAAFVAGLVACYVHVLREEREFDVETQRQLAALRRLIGGDR